jgi:hypothetical protein
MSTLCDPDCPSITEKAPSESTSADPVCPVRFQVHFSEFNRARSPCSNSDTSGQELLLCSGHETAFSFIPSLTDFTFLSLRDREIRCPDISEDSIRLLTTLRGISLGDLYTKGQENVFNYA